MKKVMSILISSLILFSLVGFSYAMTGSDEVKDDTKTLNMNQSENLEFNLQEAIQYALEHNRDLVIQDLNIEKAQIEYDDKKRMVKQYNKTKDMPSIPSYMMPPRNEPVEPDAVVNTKMLDNGAFEKSLDLSLNVPIWNKELKINEITYNVEKGYYDLGLAKISAEIAKESLELANKQYEQSKKMFELGTISQQQLITIELAVSQAQSGVDAAEMGYELQKMNFNSTLGLPLEQKVVLTDKIEYKDHEPIELKKSIVKAFENNAALKVANENYEISKLILEATKVRYPENTYRYREQAVVVETAAKNLESAKTGIEMAVRSAYLNLITSEKQIKTYELAVEKAQKALELAQISFELGQNTANDVTQARIELMDAKKNLSKQIHAYNMALLDFKYSTGLGKTPIVGGY